MIGIGSTVGNYQVLEKIGEGAMGSVFLAQHPVIGKRVALKVIHPQLAANEEMLARFFNEARAVTQIGHDNIVDVQDFGQTPDGDSFIVMELLEGRGLGDVIKKEGPFSTPRALHIAIQMADGLAAAHALGIIHRDLKPDNVVLLDRGGDPDFVKILDFGLAKLTGPTAAGAGLMQHKTKTGSVLGTPHYMAPEQAEGSKLVDQRVDVYALGCILFEMTTGRVPFPGLGFGEVLIKHLREPPPLPKRLNPNIPDDVEKIILHALAKRADFRFKSMAVFASAMRDPPKFASSVRADDLETHLTPGEPMPAPVLPPGAVEAARGPRPPPGVERKVDSDAATMMAEPAAAVKEALARARSADPLPVATFDAKRREYRPTEPQPVIALRRKRQGASPLLLLGAVLLAAAAATAVGVYVVRARPSGPVIIAVDSSPPGAEVLRDDRVVGSTPLQLTLPRGAQPILLTLKKEGFLVAQRTVVPSEDQPLSVRLLPTPARAEEEPPPAAPAPEQPPAAAAPPQPTAAAAPPQPARPPAHHPPHKKKKSDTLLLEPTF